MLRPAHIQSLVRELVARRWRIKHSLPSSHLLHRLDLLHLEVVSNDSGPGILSCASFGDSLFLALDSSLASILLEEPIVTHISTHTMVLLGRQNLSILTSY